ncbi:hypothetical protein ANN_27924 [Periplaneta americana]|uniref:C2H2-type domain-containing protein n=1 Tax=Periplaneta americana TaxID=6978 RepID=A0ABQ8RVI2_PERAM|nr:hypothetical protein ANN_27924 [Periplaneta americana]
MWENLLCIGNVMCSFAHMLISSAHSLSIILTSSFTIRFFTAERVQIDLDLVQQEGTFGVIAVKEENKVAATKEEYEVLTESVVSVKNYVVSVKCVVSVKKYVVSVKCAVSWNADDNEMPEVKDPSSENCLAPENCSSGSASDARSYNEELGRETSLQSDSHSNSLMCDICGINLPIAHSLGMHLRKHDGERKFKCDICGKCFSRSGSHKEHLRRHTGEEPLKCDKCGKYFSNSEVLVSHACTYKGEKAFKCDVCGKCFSYSGNLIAHTRTHNGEKPFKCDYCGKCFSLLRSLDNHVRTHTSEKPR